MYTNVKINTFNSKLKVIKSYSKPDASKCLQALFIPSQVTSLTTEQIIQYIEDKTSHTYDKCAIGKGLKKLGYHGDTEYHRSEKTGGFTKSVQCFGMIPNLGDPPPSEREDYYKFERYFYYPAEINGVLVELKGYGMVPEREIITTKEIRIRDHPNEPGGEVWLTAAEIEQITGVSKYPLGRILKSLQYPLRTQAGIRQYQLRFRHQKYDKLSDQYYFKKLVNGLPKERGHYSLSDLIHILGNPPKFERRLASILEKYKIQIKKVKGKRAYNFNLNSYTGGRVMVYHRG